jgi:hypothetical protein
MTSAKTIYFRSGRLHKEVKAKAGRPHGTSRVWHRNGQLAEVLRYRDGVLHGLCRFWNEDEILLGEFEMVRGTGTQRFWHDNGQIRVEISSINGQFHGRTRTWLPDATLTGEDYYIHGLPVSRTAYLKAAKANPDWPNYESEPPGKPARLGKALRLREHELFVHAVLERPTTTEAREWLQPGLARSSGKRARSLVKFRTARSALHFVERLYSAGALCVVVAGIHQGPKPGVFADWLLVELPCRKAQRAEVRRLCEEFSRRRGAGFEPEKDIGESHLFGLLA